MKIRACFLILIVANVTVTAWRGYKMLLIELNFSEYNKDYLRNATAGIIDGAGFVYVQLKKNVGQPTNFRFQMYQKVKNKYEEAFIDLTTDLCMYFRSAKNYPFLNALYPTLVKRGNLPRQCPIKAGTYVINDMKVDEELLPLYLPGEFWKINLTLFDNEALIYKVSVVIKIDHSPGKNKFGSFLS